ncbi:hypothetical protein Y032_0496g2487 [Ancylostoma ceylanicum]|nr:hypothetical protein Y032_0496g2487 [Ancylostoma ceylanicum]
MLMNQPDIILVEGESILAMKKSDQQEVLRLIRFDPCNSTQARDHTRLTLECICDGLATSAREVEEIAQSTLFKPLKSAEDILCDLVKNRFLTVDEDTTRSQNATKLSPTQLGRATLVSALPPDAALFVFADLQQATKSIVLDTELHMLYLVTPTNCSVWQGCDWNHLHSIFSKLRTEEKRVAKLVGANDRFILSRLRGSSAASSDRSYQLHLRFFSALALFDVVNEKPVDEVARRFRISRGTLQTLQQQSATYAAMVVAFCSRLGWTYLHDLLKGFAARLAFGVRRELTELVSINGLDASRARIFHDHEITSFAQLSNCTTKKVAEILSLAVPFNSDNSSDGLNEWLFGEPRMRLEEAAELLRERASDAVKEHLRSLGLNMESVTGLSQSPRAATAAAENGLAPANLPTSAMDIDKKDVVSADLVGPADKFLSPVPPKKPDRSCVRVAEGSSGETAEFVDSILEENSIDLFSESMEELTIDAQKPDRRLSMVVPDEQDGEIDDLESSLLKVSMICDKENEEPNTADDVTDSFPEACLKPSTSKDRVFTSADSGYTSMSCSSPLLSRQVLYDFTNSSPFSRAPPHPSHKRTRETVVANSPSCASPLGKASRLERASPSVSTAAELDIDDVCRTESAWNYFMQRSSLWTKVGVALAVKRQGSSESDAVHGISFCTRDGTPHYVPLSEEYFPGNETEEALCPSSTPSQSISLQERISCVSSILQSCEVSFVDALRDCHLLWKAFKQKVPKPVCVSYLAFLAHFRSGDRPLSIRELTAKFQWEFDAQRLLRMNPRIAAAVQSYLAARLVDRLSPLVVTCSSEGSLKLEVQSLR